MEDLGNISYEASLHNNYLTLFQGSDLWLDTIFMKFLLSKADPERSCNTSRLNIPLKVHLAGYLTS